MTRATLDIICLANSRKHGGRCVAGLRVDGGGWLRPVGPDGILWPADYTLTDGTEAGVLDIIRIGIESPRPAPHQPENCLIDRTRWQLRARPMAVSLVPILKKACAQGPELLEGRSDRVPYAQLEQQHAAASLALVAPDEVFVYHQRDARGRTRPQARGRFWLGPSATAHLYDLPITDPRQEPLVIQRGAQTLSQADGRFLLTISMGEPFGLDCYKLIAAIIPLPPALASVF
jgi:hypothetical protein